MKKFAIYRYRFWISFGLLALFAGLLVFWDLTRIPNGLTSGEITIAASAGKLNLSGIAHGVSDFINLPYLSIEHFAIQIFGFSILAFRLPGAILTLIAFAMLIVVIACRQRKNIAVVTGLLLVGSPLFLSIARTANAGAMAVFLLSVIVWLTALLTSGRFSGWRSALMKALLCVSSALLIYSPGGILLVGLLILIGLSHPKTRYEIFRNKWYTMLLGCLLALMVVSPILVSALHGNFDWGLLGLQGWNLKNFASSFVLFFSIRGDLVDGFASPGLNVVVILLAIYGVYRMFRSIDSARARFVLPLGTAAIFFALGNPALSFWLLIPTTFALSIGIDGLFDAWYSLFPRNPYARIFALLPISALVLLIGFGAAGGYFMDNFYASGTVNVLDREFGVAVSQLSRESAQTLVVSHVQLSFYQNLSRNFPKLSVTDRMPEHFAKNSLIVLASAQPRSFSKIPNKIITDFTSNNSILLREY